MTNTTKVLKNSFSYRKHYEKLTNRNIPNGFDVHHIDLNRENNNIENLVALPKKLHQDYHIFILTDTSFDLGYGLKSSLDPGHNYLNFLTDNLMRFRDVYNKCNAWVDFRNHLLKKHIDFRNLSPEYK